MTELYRWTIYRHKMFTDATHKQYTGTLTIDRAGGTALWTLFEPGTESKVLSQQPVTVADADDMLTEYARSRLGVTPPTYDDMEKLDMPVTYERVYD